MVFISYSSREKNSADFIRSVLTANGIECWMAPESIPKGGNYAGEIPIAIASCEAFVLVLSKASQASKWVPKELSMALDKDRIVLPIHIDNTDLNEEFKFYLSNVQRIEAYDRLSDSCHELVSRIQKIRGEEPPSSPTIGKAVESDDMRGSKGLLYRSHGDGTCDVIGIGTCEDWAVIVPRYSPDGDMVTGIAPKAFAYSKINSIILPDSITAIGSRAFDSCDSLYKVKIPDSVREIGSEAFMFCKSLSVIIVPDSVQVVGKSAFFTGNHICRFSLPPHLESLADNHEVRSIEIFIRKKFLFFRYNKKKRVLFI